MKLYDGGVIIILIFIAIVAAVGGSSYYWLGPDNPVEEVAEKIIQEETGINLDLTPTSPELSRGTLA